MDAGTQTDDFWALQTTPTSGPCRSTAQRPDPRFGAKDVNGELRVVRGGVADVGVIPAVGGNLPGDVRVFIIPVADKACAVVRLRQGDPAANGLAVSGARIRSPITSGFSTTSYGVGGTLDVLLAPAAGAGCTGYRCNQPSLTRSGGAEKAARELGTSTSSWVFHWRIPNSTLVEQLFIGVPGEPRPGVPHLGGNRQRHARRAA